MQRGQASPEQVTEEVFVRPECDAIAHPRAVMVHAHHASAADGAMVSARRLRGSALLAITPVGEVEAVASSHLDDLLIKQPGRDGAGLFVVDHLGSRIIS